MSYPQFIPELHNIRSTRNREKHIYALLFFPNFLFKGVLNSNIFFLHSSLSTTVSLLLLSAMAFTRYQVATSATSQHRVFRWAVTHPIWASVIPWIIGIIFTVLNFVDFAEWELVWQVSKAAYQLGNTRGEFLELFSMFYSRFILDLML